MDNSIELTRENITAVLKIAQDLGMRGFGGRCAAVAMAINGVLFNHTGTIIISVNEFLWTNHKHFAGHVVVKYQDTYWDGDARPKHIEHIDSWGDISGDPYYREKFKEYGARWSEKRGTTTAIYELDSDAELPWGHDEVGEYVGYLTQALEIFKKQNP